MKRLTLILITLLLGVLASSVFSAYAWEIPGYKVIEQESIEVTNPDGSLNSAKDVGFRVLGLLKILVSGFALIYIVMIGVFMILGSDAEDKIKTQRKQIAYALIGFIFLNIPGMVYDIFRPGEVTGSVGDIGSWNDTSGGSIFWSTYGFEGLIGNMIAFLRVFVYGAAIITFTWGLFRLIMSGGDDEKQKNAKHRLTYGLLGLIFLGFVEGWSRLVAVGDFAKAIPGVANKLIGLALFFAAPIAIFMMIWWAYYYITSGGEEERAKKGKAIVVNTFIATLILIAALSFMTDLVKFTL
jgi:hypothetical protein